MPFLDRKKREREEAHFEARQKLAREAAQGKGFARHLFALKSKAPADAPTSDADRLEEARDLALHLRKGQTIL